ncbi:ferritin-like domain-containing protein [Kitasatospora sp. NPDC096147]|uniref:ferritin-like domain-containing protein n=1 Tax=Kitasatospora sp. NPDC096147 TaxID=3364093 RepID=UPI0037F80CBC
MTTHEFARWVDHFEAEAARRSATADPDWSAGAHLPDPVWASLQKFQVGEDGDGANLIGKADLAGDPHYARAARLFVAEEQNHARLLARLLAAGGRATLDGHWSDRVFVLVRRLLGMRTELLVLMIAELVAVPYYRAVRDGAGDPLASRVAGLIMADEQRHIPFHCDRLADSLAELGPTARKVTVAGWRVLLLAAALFVAVDHGPALRALRAGRLRFMRDVFRMSGPVAAEILGGAEQVAAGWSGKGREQRVARVV